MASESLSDAIYTYGTVDDAVLTTRGNVLGAIELSGIEPSSVSTKERAKITQLVRHIIQRLPIRATISQYYFHLDSAEIKLKKRKNPRSQLLSSRREAYLKNMRHLNSSKLYWVIEIPPETEYDKIFSMSFLQNLFSSMFDSHARQLVKNAFSNRDALLVEYQSICRQIKHLKSALNEINLRLTFVSPDNSIVSTGSLWAIQKALVNLSPKYLFTPPEQPPIERWNTLLASGDVKTVIIEGDEYLKIEGPKAVYARIASIAGCGMEYMPESVWCSTANKPVLESGNYVFFTRFKPYTRNKHQSMASDKEQDLYRDQMSLSDFMTGSSTAFDIQQKIKKNPRLKGLIDELDDVRNSEDRYGEQSSSVVIFDTDVEKLQQRVDRLTTILESAEFSLIWESIGLIDAYKNILLGNPNRSRRVTETSSTQTAALGLIFRSHEGQQQWSFGDKKEEAIYVFESEDGVPFHYTPYIGTKCLVLGIGPTQSGKTFTKNCIATHFTKLGGMYTAMDIDQGTEPIAAFFNEDGAVFRLEDGNTSRGFNPFAMCKGETDSAFFTHMTNLIRLMLKTNSSKENQTWTADEQLEIESALTKTMRMKNKKLQTFSGMIEHCGDTSNVKNKLKRFTRGGPNGNLFDNIEDAIGVLDKPFSVYNIEGVKETPELAQLVNTEIFFRAVRLFEDPKYRETAKFLEVDECQYILSQPKAAEFLVAKARTWFKHGGGMGFWTQSPKHFSDLEEWGTLRSAATTFIFMSDPAMEVEEYKTAFPFLTDVECEIIANLIPKQQLFIKQPDIGVAKVLNLHVESEQYVIATSKAHEAALAQRIYKEEPDIDIAISRIIKDLNKEETPLC